MLSHAFDSSLTDFIYIPFALSCRRVERTGETYLLIPTVMVRQAHHERFGYSTTNASYFTTNGSLFLPQTALNNRAS
jgi:hypothetical protein